MKNLIRGLTMAVAIGALTVPNIAFAGQHHGGSGVRSGGGHVGMARSGGANFARSGGINRGVAVRNFSNNRGPSVRSYNQNRNFSNVRSSQNIANIQNRNVTRSNVARINNGQRWAGNGRHGHHRHHRGWWGPALALGSYGLYSAYDGCWDTVWTPSGYERVYVCGPDYYNYY